MKRWFPTWIVPLLVILSIATVWLRLSMVRTTYTIDQTDKLISNVRHDREKSSLKLAGLKSPRRLELLSKTKFNLAQPNANQMVYMK